jgi:transposase
MEMRMTSTSPIRTGQAQQRVSRREQRAPRGPDGRRLPRRVFTTDYKLAMLAEYDRCTVPGDKGALLRREGLYSSLITDWRRQHREGALVATPGRSEGGRGGPSKSEIDRLRAENERLKRKLAKAEAVIEVQGEVHALLEEISRSADAEDE